MRFFLIHVMTLSALLIVGGVSGASLTVGPTHGYVQYDVTVSSQTSTVEIFSVNESASPTGQNGFVLLNVSLVSIFRNLTYSTPLNTSSFPEVFPYLPNLHNQSLSYLAGGITIKVHIASTGSVPVKFNGNSYQGISYQVSALATFSSTVAPISVNGVIVTMPSGLVYSIQLQPVNSYSLGVQLEETNLPLVDPSNTGELPIGVALVTLGLLGAAAFAVPTAFLKLRRKPAAQPDESREPKGEEKPSYWVD